MVGYIGVLVVQLTFELIYLGGVYWRELGASRLFDEIAIRPTRRYYLMGLGLDRAKFDVPLM